MKLDKEEAYVMAIVCFEKAVCFESERLRYKGISAVDSENLVRWRSNKHVYESAINSRAINLEEHEAWFEGYMQDKKSLRLVITEKKSGKDIGMVGGECKDAFFVLSYYIGESDFRGMGYAGEAINSLIEYVITNTTIQVFQANVLPSNRASINCLSKIGFVLSTAHVNGLRFTKVV